MNSWGQLYLQRSVARLEEGISEKPVNGAGLLTGGDERIQKCSTCDINDRIRGHIVSESIPRHPAAPW